SEDVAVPGGEVLETGLAREAQVAQQGGGRGDPLRPRGLGEEDRPADEVGIEARAHPERALRVPHPLEPERHHARRGERHEMARHDHSRVAVRGALALRPFAVEHGDPVAPIVEIPGRAETGDAGAENEDVRHGGQPPAPLKAGIPQQNGSLSSRSSVDSAMRCARPVMTGRMPPSGAGRYDASKRLPRTLSCTHTSSGASRPSAARQASLALVPVPHGERSHALPGQSTKLRLSAPSAGTNSSTWSMASPSGPVIPPASRARRIAQVSAVSVSTCRRAIEWGYSLTRKNQLPPQATSPVTVP